MHYCENNSKIQSKYCKNRGKLNTPNTYIYVINITVTACYNIYHDGQQQKWEGKATSSEVITQLSVPKSNLKIIDIKAKSTPLV